MLKVVILFLLLVKCMKPIETTCPSRNVIQNRTRGTITFSQTNTPFPNVSQQYICQWKIHGIDGRKIVNLNVTKFHTACSKSFLRIQDGCDGENTETEVVALLSGQRQHLLELLYVLMKSCVQIDFYYGFGEDKSVDIQLEYNLRNCPLTCQEYHCPDRHCSVCNNGRVGRFCQLPKGNCELSASAPICKCSNSTQVGYECSLTRNSYTKKEYGWHIISPLTFPEPEPSITGRIFAASASAPVEGGLSNDLYLHGGHDLNGKLFQDLRIFSIHRKSWTLMTVLTAAPRPRFGHTLTPAPYKGNNKLFLYGGYLNLARSEVSDELWRLTRTVHGFTWKRLTCSANCPPALAFHTVTVVRGNQLWLFGGLNEDGEANGRLFIISLGLETFHVVEKKDTSGWTNRLRLFGHTAVYDEVDDRFLVFGGMRLVSSHSTVTEPGLFSYSFSNNAWSLLSQDSKAYRVFHSTLIVGDYLVVYGGCLRYNTDIYPTYDNNCLDSLFEMELFHLRCHVWSKLSDYQHAIPQQRYQEKVGRFGQNVFALNSYTIVIFGGFSGVVRNDVLAFVFPPVITRDQKQAGKYEEDICLQNEYFEACNQDPMCRWNERKKNCFYYESMSESPLSSQCHGVCPLLTTCSDCTSHNSSHKWWSDCVWCHEENRCISRREQSNQPGVCSHSSTTICKSSPVYEVCLQASQSHCSECLQPDNDFVWSRTGHCYDLHCIEKHRLPLPDSWLIREIADCPGCRGQSSCYQCGNYSSNCQWDAVLDVCMEKLSPVGHGQQSCRPCRSLNTCHSCLYDKNCIWCSTQSMCISRAEYSTRLIQNCLTWQRSPALYPINTYKERIDQVCSPCSQHTDCKSCLLNSAGVYCAWIYNYKSSVRAFCTTLPLSNSIRNLGHNVATEQCPTVNECSIPGLSDCHPNADCIDTAHSYHCQCRPGYSGDGKTDCRVQCIVECVHGRCSNNKVDECECEFSYVGSRCEEDCGCHGHSDCNDDKSKCLNCLHNTEGDRCQFCRKNFYGNATSSQRGDSSSCLPCYCNGHGIPHRFDDQSNDNLLLCHPISGQCFCTNHTAGKQCEQCSENYFPIIDFPGSPCAAKCDGKLILSDNEGYVASENLIGSCSALFQYTSQEKQEDDSFYVFQMNRENLSQLSCISDCVNLYSGQIASSVYHFNLTHSTNQLIHRLCVDTSSSANISDIFVVRAATVTLVAQLSRARFSLYYRRVSCLDENHPLYDRNYCSSNQLEVTDLDHARIGHSVTSCSGVVYQFGGVKRSGLGSITNDLFTVATVDNRPVWKRIVANCKEGKCPGVRAYHSAICDSRESLLLIVGGIDESGLPAYSHTASIYNISSNEWFHASLPFPDWIKGFLSPAVSLFVSEEVSHLFIIGGIVRKRVSNPSEEAILLFNSSIALPIQLNSKSENTISPIQMNDIQFYNSSFKICPDFYNNQLIGSYHLLNTEQIYVIESGILCPDCFQSSNEHFSFKYKEPRLSRIDLTESKKYSLIRSSLPCAPLSPAVILLDGNDTILCYGGRNLDGSVSDSSIYVISISKNKWATLPLSWVSNCELRPVYGAKMFTLIDSDANQNLYISGGMGANNRPNGEICRVIIPSDWYHKIFTKEITDLDKLVRRNSGCNRNLLKRPCLTCGSFKGNSSCSNWYLPGLGTYLSAPAITFYMANNLAGPLTCQKSNPICQREFYCHNCTALQSCGWLINSGPHGGECLAGGFDGPMVGSMNKTRWFFTNCPLENECLNGHHNCNTNQICVNRKESFVCECRENYRLDSITKQCQPVCSNGCGNGTCIAPQQCRCNFGFGGIQCKKACPCYGNGVCDKNFRCIQCFNNTTGKSCSFCKPGYIGDPTRGIKCVSCLDHCNGHSTNCKMTESNGVNGSVICTNCHDQTEGKRCHLCRMGYFRRERNTRLGCQPCHCNGHGNLCDQSTGLRCVCLDNTQTSPNCDNPKRNSLKHIITCSRLQCAQCKTPNYMGNPSNSRQCYRSIKINKSTCINEGSLYCSEQPEYLPANRSVFYYFHQPEYKNDNIRLIIEIKQGLVDVYISSNSELFGLIDNQVVFMNDSERSRRYGRSAQYGFENGRIHRLRVTVSHVKDNLISDYKLVQIKADTPAHYARLNSRHKVLHIQNVRHMLVLTVDALKYGPSFVIIKAKELTQGDLVYRRLEPHVNLFVFFSVFFCCFFLLLALCVLVWKLKIYSDRHRARIRETVARKTMAARPFRQILVWMDPTDSDPEPPDESSPPFHPVPMAIEPLRQSSAAVVTLLIQLPGPEMCLGSTLVTSRSLNLNQADSASQNPRLSGPGAIYRRGRENSVRRRHRTNR